jgi:hypothetical protein
MANGNFAGGNGTASSPWLIEDALDVNAMRNKIDACYRLIKDIDMSSIANWSPMGSTYSRPNHIVDGNGFKIMNLRSVVSGNYAGLYGISGNLTISNLRLENVYISGEIAGAFGGSIYGSLRNCSTSGIVIATSDGGGIAGSCSANLTNCYSECDVTGYWTTGGLVGNSGTALTNCYATGGVTGFRDVGGIVGLVLSSGTVKNCFALNEYIARLASSTSANIGDIYGNKYGTSSPITNCFSIDTLEFRQY